MKLHYSLKKFVTRCKNSLSISTFESMVNTVKSFFTISSKSSNKMISPIFLTLVFLLGVSFTSYAQIAEIESNNTPTAAGVHRLYQGDTFSGVVTDVGDIDYWQISKSAGATGQIKYLFRKKIG